MRPLAILMLSALALLPVACERAAPARDQATPAAASASAMEFRGERPAWWPGDGSGEVGVPTWNDRQPGILGDWRIDLDLSLGRPPQP